MAAAAAKRGAYQSKTKHRATGRGSRLRLVKNKGFVLEWEDTVVGYKALQKACKQLRLLHNWTQEELAEKAGMCHGTIIRFEDLQRPMLAPRLKTYAKIFGRAFGIKMKLAE